MWNWTENKMKINFIRHGMTKFNEEKRYLGLLDVSLSEKGKAEIEKRWHDTLKPDVVVTSPLKRCVQSAELIIKDMKNKKHIIVDEFREIDFGIFEVPQFLGSKKRKRLKSWEIAYFQCNGILS